MVSTAKELKHEILAVLSSGAGQAGRKLKSEQEIADALEVPKHRVRQALGRLKAEGVLVRRGRAGTYIRKVPTEGEGINSNSPQYKIDASKIIEFEQDSMPLDAWAKKSSKLNLSMWGDLEYVSPATQIELSGIIKQVQESGHRLTVHSIVREKDCPLPHNILEAQLHEHLYDGYIVTNFWADYFKSAFKNIKSPVVYVHSGSSKIVHEPVVFMDVYEAIQRAVEKFADAGLSKIAYLGYQPYKQHQEDAVSFYNYAMNKLGFGFRMESHTNSLCLAAAKEAMLKLLDAQNRPQAVYVSDNFLMPGVVEALKTRNMAPGRDIAIITLGSKKIDLPSGYNWSVLQFDHELLGRTAADMLIRMLKGSNLAPCNLGLRASWIEGQTHFMKKQ